MQETIVGAPTVPIDVVVSADWSLHTLNANSIEPREEQQKEHRSSGWFVIANGMKRSVPDADPVSAMVSSSFQSTSPGFYHGPLTGNAARRSERVVKSVLSEHNGNRLRSRSKSEAN